MRYRCFSALSGKKVFTMVMIVFVMPTVFGSCGKYVRQRTTQIRQNVIFQGSNLGGLQPDEARVVVSRIAEELRVAPVDAVEDSETGGVIPDINGLEVDVEQTMVAVQAAETGEKVNPVYREIQATITMTDFPELPIYQGNPAKQQVVFLINVAWGNEFLAPMLETLKEENVGATFFLVGRWVRQNPELAQAIADAGFELANHGDSDGVSMGRIGLNEAIEQIRKCADTIESTCGVRPVYFSPHRGELSEHVKKAAIMENSRVVMWTVDTVDWKLPGVDVMTEKIMNNAGGGSLILMHPTEQTNEFLRQVIPALREKSLEPVTLSTLLNPGYFADKGVNVP
ncbi:MAG: polysaccharide deacetylase family protein [Clostridiales bacterium]|jgi:probable sporulation protein (polysaccharide deacetylase family)|nr:polysaccharide deacetylase family protein [Clostridiales bacterium]